MKATIVGKNILLNNKTVHIEELFSMESIAFANRNAQNYYSDLCVDNELFEKYVIPFHDFCRFLDENKVDEIECKNAEDILNAMSIASHRIITHKFCRIFSEIKNRIFSEIKSKIYKVGTFTYLLIKQFNQKCKPQSQTTNAIVFIRSKATKAKFKHITNIDKLFEEKPGVGTLYQQFTLRERISILIGSISKVNKLENEISRALISYGLKEFVSTVKLYYSQRLVHTLFYISLLDKYIKDTDYDIIYTGNNLDRFAYYEEKISKNYKKELRVIPHGIEYGYRFPKCFVGDLFYTCSENAANYLNALYHTEKFFFNEEIGRKMFEVDRVQQGISRIVYFSEPREYQVNIDIIKSMLPILQIEGITLYLKLHPKDVRNNYEQLFRMGVIEITDFNDAICGNICVSRKSTILLEATYNYSKAVAILTNEKDKCVFNSFPSLQDNRIICFQNSFDATNYIIHIFKRDALHEDEK